jgi:diguanylate cyclase (GGDEF)-like protein
MSSPTPRTRPTARRADANPLPLLVAVVTGMTLCATIALADPLPDLPGVLTAALAVGAGLVTTLTLLPWRQLRRPAALRADIRRLTRQVEHAKHSERADALKKLAVSHDEDLRHLGRAIERSAAESFTLRRESQRMHRTMGDSIRRATDKATARLRRQAATDHLTGLANRRGLEDRIAALFRSEACPERITALAVDVDLFKQINDSLGHDVGDRCLVFLSRLLTSSLRHEDTAVRLGGDEFLVLLPGLDARQAREIAERISSLFAQMPWSHRQIPRPTLSIGIASTHRSSPMTPEQLLTRADQALYQSKRVGRARITDHATA